MEQCFIYINYNGGRFGHYCHAGGLQDVENLVVTLLISTTIGFLIICTINFIFGENLNLPWIPDQSWHHKITLEIALMSLLIGGVSTFIIMLGTMISKIIVKS